MKPEDANADADRMGNGTACYTAPEVFISEDPKQKGVVDIRVIFIPSLSFYGKSLLGNWHMRMRHD
jgi:hypothetical protein